MQLVLRPRARLTQRGSGRLGLGGHRLGRLPRIPRPAWLLATSTQASLRPRRRAPAGTTLSDTPRELSCQSAEHPDWKADPDDVRPGSPSGSEACGCVTGYAGPKPLADRG